jgi:hypothetical protein
LNSAETSVVPPPPQNASERKCPFCAEHIVLEAKKCKHCGEFLGVTPSTTAPLSDPVQGLAPYYRDEFQQIQASGERYLGKWNWAAFFFGGFWAISKGLWKAGLISIVGSFFTYGLVGIIYWFIFGVRGNYMYYSTIIKHQEPWI